MSEKTFYNKLANAFNDPFIKNEIMKPEINRPEINKPQITPNSGSNNNDNRSSDKGPYIPGEKTIYDKIRDVMQAIEDAKKKAVEETDKQKGSSQGQPQEGPGTIREANDGSGIIEYTYAPGDTFGRVLIKTGLSDGRNLWGPEGDVAYYTKQLNDQGISGNIPIGSTIRLKKRR